MFPGMRKIVEHPIVRFLSFLGFLIRTLPWLWQGVAPMFDDPEFVGIVTGAAGMLFFISTGLWIESNWKRLKHVRASLYLRRSSVRGDIRNLREAILRNDYQAIFRGMQNLYPKLQSRGIVMMKTRYQHADGSSGWHTPLEDSKWLALHDDLLSNLERMPRGRRLIWNVVIGKASDFDFDEDRWCGYVKRREGEFAL